MPLLVARNRATNKLPQRSNQAKLSVRKARHAGVRLGKHRTEVAMAPLNGCNTDPRSERDRGQRHLGRGIDLDEMEAGGATNLWNR